MAAETANATTGINGATAYDVPAHVSKYLPFSTGTPTDSFWLRDIHDLHNHRTTEELPAHSDVAIIGGGYAGIATAYNLVKGDKPNDLSVTVFEARGICSGATGRNGGHLRPDLYGHIPTYIDRAGLEAAAALAEFEIAHVWAIKELVEKEKIDCDFTLARTIDVWCNEEAATRAKKVYDMMVAHGLAYMKDVFFTVGKDAEGISGVKGAKACASYTAGTMWPYKFILGLTQVILETGKANVQANTPVTAVTPDPAGGFMITTPRGKMHATKVIHASNAYAAALLPEYEKNIVPCKGICCRIAIPEGGKPAPLLNNSYINRTDDLTLSYLVPRADGSIVVGGASSKFRPFLDQWYNNVDDSVLIDAAKDYYDGYMQRTFRGWEDSNAVVDKIWTGVMGYSWDSNPHVGTVPEKDGQYIIAGFNGHGMPVIWLAGKALAEMIIEDKPFEKLGLPILLKTTKERIEKAQNGPEGGDILA